MSAAANISRFLQLLKGQQDSTPQRRAGRRGFRQTLETVQGQRTQRPLALVVKGREVSFKNVPFFDTDGNKLQIQSYSDGGKTVVDVKKSGKNAKRSLSKPTTPGMKLEAKLSGNSQVDQAIPNLRDHVREHLKQTRELRHGILSGELETPGTKGTRLKKKLVEENGSELDKLVAKLENVRGDNQNTAVSLAALGMRISRNSAAGDDGKLVMSDSVKSASGNGKDDAWVGKVIDANDIDAIKQLKKELPNPLERRVSAFTPRRVDKNGNALSDSRTSAKNENGTGEKQVASVSKQSNGKAENIVPLKETVSNKAESGTAQVEQKSSEKSTIAVSLRQSQGKVSAQTGDDSRIVSKIQVKQSFPEVPGDDIIRQREQLKAFTRHLTQGKANAANGTSAGEGTTKTASQPRNDIDDSQIKRLVKDAVKQADRGAGQETKQSLEAEAYLKKRNGRPNRITSELSTQRNAAPSKTALSDSESSKTQSTLSELADTTQRRPSRLTRQAVQRAFPRNGNGSNDTTAKAEAKQDTETVKSTVKNQDNTQATTPVVSKQAKQGKTVAEKPVQGKSEHNPVSQQAKNDGASKSDFITPVEVNTKPASSNGNTPIQSKPQVAPQPQSQPQAQAQVEQSRAAKPQPQAAQQPQSQPQKVQSQAQAQTEQSNMAKSQPQVQQVQQNQTQAQQTASPTSQTAPDNAKPGELLSDAWRVGNLKADDANLKTDSRRGLREVITDTWQNVRGRLSRKSNGKESQQGESNRDNSGQSSDNANAMKTAQAAKNEQVNQAAFKEAVQAQQQHSTTQTTTAATTAKTAEGWQSSLLNNNAESNAESVKNLNDVLQKIQGRAELLKAGESASIRILLKPNDLGAASVLIKRSDKKYDIVVTTDSKEAAKHIEAQTAQFKEQLSQSGIQLNKFDVDTGEHRQQTRGEAAGDQEGRNRGNRDQGQNARAEEQQQEVEQYHARSRTLGTNTVEYVG